MEPIWFAVVVSFLLMVGSLVALYVWNHWEPRTAFDNQTHAYEPVDLVFDDPITENDTMKLEEGKRVMLKGELMDTHNGIYVKQKGRLVRARDMSSDRHVRSGTYVFLKDSDEVYTLATYHSTTHTPYQGISIGMTFVSLKDQVFGTTRKPTTAILGADERGRITWLERRQKVYDIRVEKNSVGTVRIPIPIGISTISITNMSDLFWIARCVRAQNEKPILSVDSKTSTSDTQWISPYIRDDHIMFNFNGGKERILDLKIFIA